MFNPDDHSGVVTGPALSASLTERAVFEEPCPFRGPFQRDRDRIIHTKAFRRLAHKTQVFLNPSGDHYRTRLTHTLEVSQIARTLARALGLNEDLTEAIALGHDLGHTPFGHSGERVLARLNPAGFSHQAQSLRIVDRLAKDGRGLNLTLAVRDGIGKHSKGRGPIFISGPKAPLTYEGQLVRAADIIAYLAHDLDDAIRSGLLPAEAAPPPIASRFGASSGSRISAMVRGLMEGSRRVEGRLHLAFTPDMELGMELLRTFLHDNIYNHPELVERLSRGDKVVEELYLHFLNNPALFQKIYPLAVQGSPHELITDFISGMTDRYALDLHQQIFWPGPGPGPITALGRGAGPSRPI